MTFKKNSESDKDNVVNAGSESNKPSNTKKKHHLSSGAIFALVLVALISFWAITTIVIPLNRSSGAEKYEGQFRDLAEAIYEFESINNKADLALSQMYKIHIEDIHLTTDEERVEYCTDPERITTDSNRTMAYTVVLSEQLIGWWGKDEYRIVGCQTSILGRAFK